MSTTPVSRWGAMPRPWVRSPKVERIFREGFGKRAFVDSGSLDIMLDFVRLEGSHATLVQYCTTLELENKRLREESAFLTKTIGDLQCQD